MNAPPQSVPVPPSSAVMDVKIFASAANGKPVPDAAIPAPVNDPKDAIANSMAAIGTAVGVVALLLAVGTSWLKRPGLKPVFGVVSFGMKNASDFRKNVTNWIGLVMQ